MITPVEILSGTFSLSGEPWIKVASGNINPNTLEFSFDGSPWWGVSGPVSIGHIKSINGVAWEHIKSYNGVDQSHIKTALGIEG